jgi:redox-sensitive bicupin YhaK (pirin superfamily)
MLDKAKSSHRGEATMKTDPIISTQALGFPWACFDPFLFCAYHEDRFPAGNAGLGPKDSLQGRNLGQDFDNKDGWNMYHGHVVPGFPRHPHRGFETVTVVRKGYVDHSDSLGAVARYGQGDAQWLTTGSGISHTEMFPLLNSFGPNPTELFQIWLNLPPSKKMAAANFKIVWAETQPRASFGSEGGPKTELNLVAGSLSGLQAPPPPPDSWAAFEGSEVTIATITMQAGAAWVLPMAQAGLSRTLYLHKGSLHCAGKSLTGRQCIRLHSGMDVALEAGAEGCDLLLLQGKPIAAPVVQYGPFVLNTRQELEDTFRDYRNTEFGGWPWPDDAPVHAASEGRFARYPGGREERPPSKP